MIWQLNLMSKFAYSFFAILALSFLFAEPVTAQCACANRNRTALQEFNDATVVFSGEIVDIQKSDPDERDGYYETTKIAVDRAWKVNIDSIVTIKNYVQGCIQGWKTGDKYLVYAYLNKDKATYSTGCCCSRTGKLEKTESDISEFYNYGHSLSHVKFPQNEKIIIAGWMNSRAVNFQNPKFPSTATKPRSVTRVEVRIVTDVNGNVMSAYVSRGPVDLHKTALDAARSLKFPPTLLSGIPTKVSGWVSFELQP